MIRIVGSVLALGVMLVACATTNVDPAGSNGWRRGLVLAVGDAAGLGEIDDGDCRRRAATAEPVGRYVEVRYFVGRHAHLRIVPLADDANVAAGDAVYFKPGSCLAAVVR